jgi:regulator of PEP synthase PpsR (kinase-PPPase family)
MEYNVYGEIGILLLHLAVVQNVPIIQHMTHVQVTRDYVIGLIITAKMLSTIRYNLDVYNIQVQIHVN